jgi:hypothetical protein
MEIFGPFDLLAMAFVRLANGKRQIGLQVADGFQPRPNVTLPNRTSATSTPRLFLALGWSDRVQMRSEGRPVRSMAMV